MPLFDVYIAVDFSGSKDQSRQKSSIVVAEAQCGTASKIQKDRFTRWEAVLYLLQRILHYNSDGKRVLCGFDFCYAFPRGFWSDLTDRSEAWDEVIADMANGLAQLPAIEEKPESNARRWAEIVNQKISRRFEIGSGPFWGPGFSQLKDPRFPFSKVSFSEYRLAERRGPGFKPIFKIGGQGAVGLQSLCGMPYLHHIRTTCLQQKAPLHCWPFDGWEPEGPAHFLVEWYPALYNEGTKSHEADALACVNWAMELDGREGLRSYFVPDLSEEKRNQATIEGWVLGIL
jgi:hypothetical protein